jgi:hypothetical protein
MFSMTDDQMRDKLEQMGKESVEVMNFAHKKNKLDLYKAAEMESYVLARALQIVDDYLTENKER